MKEPKKVSDIRNTLKSEIERGIFNPFVKGWAYLVNKMIKKKDDDTFVEYDVMRNTQVALNPDPEYRDDFLRLSSGAKDLYWWILMSLDRGECVVYVNREHFMKKTKPLKADTFRRLVNELESVEFIMKYKNDFSEDVFIVNPKFAFRGSRLTHFNGNKIYK